MSVHKSKNLSQTEKPHDLLATPSSTDKSKSCNISKNLANNAHNQLDDWLDWYIPTSHEAGYLIRGFT